LCEKNDFEDRREYYEDEEPKMESNNELDILDMPVSLFASSPKKKKVIVERDEIQEWEHYNCEEIGMKRECGKQREEGEILEDDFDLLGWWRDTGSKLFPNLATLARKYLAIPGASVDCERTFSNAGHLVRKKRCSLTAAHTSQLVLLHKNKEFWQAIPLSSKSVPKKRKRKRGREQEKGESQVKRRKKER